MGSGRPGNTERFSGDDEDTPGPKAAFRFEGGEQASRHSLMWLPVNYIALCSQGTVQSPCKHRWGRSPIYGEAIFIGRLFKAFRRGSVGRLCACLESGYSRLTIGKMTRL
ncbi:hypothetical protein DPMN_131289 [Dreissena polymorpha]|uniref:Uncharacterized protein n=1 Tax=Dreissena polymorpha TaxID=45954 RepID=A0A9D4JYB1_DREPO|nr:hypothetical protein DPMN_131260 [Dreissena polymorpha]KAH3829294.1 hypothetical protein DPMN_131289 [Dreissena polymorpha]